MSDQEAKERLRGLADQAANFAVDSNIPIRRYFRYSWDWTTSALPLLLQPLLLQPLLLQPFLLQPLLLQPLLLQTLLLQPFLLSSAPVSGPVTR